MPSLVAAFTRRMQAPRDISLNSTLTPLHKSDSHGGPGSGSNDTGKGEDLDANEPHGGDSAGSNAGSNAGNDGSGGGDSKGNSSGNSSSQSEQHWNSDPGKGVSQGGGSGEAPSDCGAAMKPLMPDPKQCTAVNENVGLLKYSPGWVLSSGDPNGKSLTSHSTTVNGSTVVIDFEGASILIFGTVHPSNMSATPPSASYSIDGRRAIQFSLPASNRCIPNQQFFQSPTLVPGAHNLTITITTAGTPYILDYLWFCGASKPSADSSGTSSKTSQERSSRKDAIVVGSVLGGVIFLLALAALAWVVIRRRKKRRKLRILKIAESPMSSWLHGQNRSGSGSEVAFTSTESIMRDNHTYSSSADSKEHQLRALGLSVPITTMPLPELPELPPGLSPLQPSSEATIHYTPDGHLISLAPPPWTVRRGSS